MPWNRIRALCCTALLAMTLPAASARAVDPAEKLLPATTKGFVSIASTKELADRWNKTQLGQLVKDPVMKPFADDLRRQFEDRLANLRKKLGLTLADLKGVPGGELSLAVIQPEEGQMALALLVDVTDHQAEAETLLEKVAEQLTERGAKQSEATLLETPLVVFDLPKQEDGEFPEPDDAPQRQAIYFLKDNLLCASDSLDVIKGVLARLAGQQGATLADVPAFRAVMDRCAKDAGDEPPQIRWFLEPFGFIKAIRAAVPERRRRRGKRLVDHLAATGFTAVQGVGGSVGFAVDRYEMLHCTAIYAPKPYEKSMKMVSLPNTTESKPQPWVPRDITACTTFYVDVLNAFDHIRPIFNAVVGQGAEGDHWQEVLDGLKEDEWGPHIDLREELFKNLDNQVTMITDYTLPISTNSERLLFAVATRDPDAVAKAIEKNFKDEEEMEKREFEGHVIWEVVPGELPEVEAVTLELPPLGFDAEEEDDEPQGAPFLPNMAVTVAHGHLLVASHYEFLVKILTPIDEREALGRAVDYLFVESTIKDSGGSEVCVQSFSRTDAAYRPTYELIRQGKMPESRTILGRILNTIFDVGKKGTMREQKIDGSKLPEFEYVRRHLGPAGLFAVSEPDGWFVKGFTLRKETE